MSKTEIIENLRFEAKRNEAASKLSITPEYKEEYKNRAKLFRDAADLLEGKDD